MFKKINFYLLKLFIFYFIIIFFILFFLFIIEFIWSKLHEIIGKGINVFLIIKLLFYFGITVIPLIIPIVILLTSIMIYGIFSESYELIAVKSLGISLWRIMYPIFIIIIIISILIYLLSDYIIPFAQKKIQDIAYNIINIQYSMNLPIGQFITYIPNVIIKIDKKIENNYYQNIYIKIIDSSFKNIKTILAKKGLLIPYQKNNFFYFKLFYGTIYQEVYLKYSYQIIKFDTLIQKFKIPVLINKQENIITKLNSKELINQIFFIEKKIQQKKMLFFKIKKKLIKNSNIHLKKLFTRLFIKITQEEKYLMKIKLALQRKLSFLITCIIMFFIGAPIGTILKQGNIGFPVIITLIIFVIYYILLNISIYLSEQGICSIIIGAWSVNFLMCPIGLFLTYKTNNDLFI